MPEAVTRLRSDMPASLLKTTQQESVLPRIAVAMMQRDEETRLEAWILYHAYLFGFDSLHIFDNGSTSKLVKTILDKYSAAGVHVYFDHRGPNAFKEKGMILAANFIELESDPQISFFIPLDCDEFMVLRLASGELRFGRSPTMRYLEQLIDDKRILVVNDAYPNVFGQPGHFFGPYVHHKVFFTSGCCAWMSEGFHTARSRKTQEEHVTNFVYLHFHHRTFEDMVLQSRRKLEHEVDVTDRTKLDEYNGPGSHVKRFLSMDKNEYEALFNPAERFVFPLLRPYLEILGVKESFFQSI